MTATRSVILCCWMVVVSPPILAGQGSDHGRAVLPKLIRPGDRLSVYVADSALVGSLAGMSRDTLLLRSADGLTALRVDLLKAIERRRSRHVVGTALLTGAAVGLLTAATTYLAYEGGGTDLSRTQLSILLGTTLGVPAGLLIGTGVALARPSWVRVYP